MTERSVFKISVMIMVAAFNMGLAKKGADIHIKMSWGDDVTEYHLEGKTLHRINSSGSKKMELNEANYNFLLQKTALILQGKTNDIHNCMRSYMAVSDQKKNVVGCVNSQTNIAKKMTNLMNLLGTVFQ